MTTTKLMTFPKLALRVLPLALSVAVAVAAGGHTAAMAQTVQNLKLANVPPDLIPEDGHAQPGAAPASVDLGQVPSSTNYSAAPQARASAGTAQQAARNARTQTPAGSANGKASAKAVRPSRAQASAGIERAVFERVPIRVALPVGKERLVTLPAVAALHVPTDIESVARIEVIDRTIYVTALVPFVPLRIVAELVDDGTQIPMDFVAGTATVGATSELQVFLGGRSGTATADGADDADEQSAEKPLPAADMVQLTRYAAQMLYAPRRLIQPSGAIQQVPVSSDVVPGLVRGALVETAPLGQWKSGNLFVTAVRVTNLSSRPYEIALEQMRGRWIAATAQHGRLGPKGSDRDTTALYLVCDRSFEACL